MTVESKNIYILYIIYLYILGCLFKNQKRKSFITMQNNELMVNQWFNEDKEHVSKNYSLIDNLD